MKPRDPYAETVGRVVRTFRQVRGISLREMAEAMGMSVSGWSRVETGDTTMVVGQLRKAARRLGVEPHEIAREADNIYATLGLFK